MSTFAITRYASWPLTTWSSRSFLLQQGIKVRTSGLTLWVSSVCLGMHRISRSDDIHLVWMTMYVKVCGLTLWVSSVCLGMHRISRSDDIHLIWMTMYVKVCELAIKFCDSCRRTRDKARTGSKKVLNVRHQALPLEQLYKSINLILSAWRVLHWAKESMKDCSYLFGSCRTV